MDAPIHSAGESRLPVESRRFPRRPVLFASIQVSGDSSGLILNISEGGLCVQTAREIAGDGPLQMRFQSLQSEGWVETQGRVIWRNEAKTVAGIAFVGLAPEAQKEVRTWLSFGNSLQELRGSWAVGHAREIRPAIKTGPFAAADETKRQRTSLSEASQSSDAPAVRYEEPSGSPRRPREALTISELPLNTHRIAAFVIAVVFVLLAALAGQRGHVVQHASGLLSKMWSAAHHNNSDAADRRPPEADVPKSFAPPPLPASAKAASAIAPLASDPSAKSGDRLKAEAVKEFALQVAAMSEEENANQLSESLRSKQFPALVSKKDGDRLYKVIVGPYADKNELRAAQNALEKDGIKPIVKRWAP
jgi:cell division septation protein DedD